MMSISILRLMKQLVIKACLTLPCKEQDNYLNYVTLLSINQLNLAEKFVL